MSTKGRTNEHHKSKNIALGRRRDGGHLYIGFCLPAEILANTVTAFNAARVLALYTNNNLEFRFGVVLMVITGAFALPWAVVMVAQMARIEKGFPIWAVLMGLASTLGTWLFAFPPIVWGIAAWLVTRNPDLTLLVHQAGFICFVAPACFFPLQIAPIAVIAFSKHNTDKFTPYPRWLGWLTLWTLLLGDLGVMAFVFNSGPFAWNGIFSFYIPLVVFSLWITAVIYCLLRAIGQQEKALIPPQLAAVGTSFVQTVR